MIGKIMVRIKTGFADVYRMLVWSVRYPVSFFKKIGVLCDYIALYFSKGLLMKEYYEFEFEKSSPEFRSSFLGVREQRHYLDLLNPVNYYIMARNKYAAHKMMEDFGIRMAPLYCYYDPYACVSDLDKVASSVSEVVRIMKSQGLGACVVKGTEDSHGEGVVVAKEISYEEHDAVLVLHDGSTTRLTEILTRSPKIIEGLVEQTSQFAQFNATSVNTVRFMTTLYPNGDAKVIAAFAKIGRAGSCVDNAGSGGNVDVCIDVATGEITQAVRYDGVRRVSRITHHPDSGARLEGAVVEHWVEIKAAVERYQQRFPWCKAAGWDVAITDDGPVVIEVNDMWDRTGQLFVHRGWRKEIRECYMAWKAAGYKAYRGRLENDFSKRKCGRIFG